ncbi:MAG TPA: ABC transporter ATP-binding protein [Kiritimatiellia bacterium]|nr:ABC transporter ATP-binding protein [Kiritimatiellia bacterium]HMP34852.1 ABC transporter ATP-binding protein [Kiritimatiellia bacterium]
MPDPLLQLAEVQVTFASDLGEVSAVDRVSFSVERGEVVALVGESGSGKSATALAIGGLLPGHARVGGSIRLDGAELVGRSSTAWRGIRGRRIAYVFQEPATALNPVFTAGYQVSEALKVAGRRDSLEERIAALLESVGLRDAGRIASSYPHQLSGGQQQRVVMAMALAGEPELLIADEPTTALDVTVQAQILELLAELQRSRGLAVLLITHNLAIAARLARRMVVLYAGQVVEEGPAAEMVHAPRHPYTHALLRAVPKLRGAGSAADLVGIPGQIPSPMALPSGCRFHPRCARCVATCRGEVPELADTGSGWRSRCPFAREVGT